MFWHRPSIAMAALTGMGFDSTNAARMMGSSCSCSSPARVKSPFAAACTRSVNCRGTMFEITDVDSLVELNNPDLITPAVQEVLRNGEQSGQVGRPLLGLADFLDEENEVIVKSLTSILEPIILIVLGIVVGFVALSMFLPLFDLTSAANG